MDRDTVVFRISGAFFFGAAATVAAALDRIAERPRNYVLDFAAVAMIDSTAATTVAGFVRKQRRRQARVFITGASPTVRRELLAHEVGEPEVDFRTDVAAALQECRRVACTSIALRDARCRCHRKLPTVHRSAEGRPDSCFPPGGGRVSSALQWSAYDSKQDCEPG